LTTWRELERRPVNERQFVRFGRPDRRLPARPDGKPRDPFLEAGSHPDCGDVDGPEHRAAEVEAAAAALRRRVPAVAVEGSAQWRLADVLGSLGRGVFRSDDHRNFLRSWLPRTCFRSGREPAADRLPPSRF